MDASFFFLGGIEPTTGTIIVAVIVGAFGLATRWLPKTRSEAGLDRANTKLIEAQALAITVQEQRQELKRVHSRVDELENSLEEERRECDRRIDQLTEEHSEQIAELRDQLDELRSRIKNA